MSDECVCDDSNSVFSDTPESVDTESYADVKELNFSDTSFSFDCLDDFHESTEHTFISDVNNPEFDDSVAVKSSHNEISQFLLMWSVSQNIPHGSLTLLLKGLQKWHPELPSCAATLFNNHRSKEPIIPLGAGEFVYMGIEDKLSEVLKNGTYKNVVDGGILYDELSEIARAKKAKLVTLTFNIDGIPLFKSTSKSIWPIVCHINEYTYVPFIIAAYYGQSKPACLNSFFEKFVAESVAINRRTICVDGCDYFIAIYAFTCDAPARSFIKGTKLCSGYDGCDFCRQRGEYSREHRKIIYTDMQPVIRTDEEFRKYGEIGHQMRISPLVSIDQLDMIQQFPPDYMHLVHLGVMKRLLQYWKKSMNDFSCEEFSRVIQGLGASLPREFHRKTRSLKELDRWKATEYRNFLMYVAPMCLKDILTSDRYRHFLLLHFAIYVMTSREHRHYLDNARACLHRFVSEIPDLYGEEMLVYNMHGLLHLADSVEKIGLLDFWSAYKFENFLQLMKKRIRSPTNILQQLRNRFHEMFMQRSHEFKFYLKEDDFCVTNDGLVCFTEKVSDKVIKGFKCELQSELYDYPYPSSSLGIGVYHKSEFETTSNFLCKCVSFQISDFSFAVIPFAHPCL